MATWKRPLSICPVRNRTALQSLPLIISTELYDHRLEPARSGVSRSGMYPTRTSITGRRRKVLGYFATVVGNVSSLRLERRAW